MYWYMLDDADGTMEDGSMVVRCGDELTMETLNCPEVVQVIQKVSEEAVGEPIAVRFLLGDGSARPVDKLEELIRQGSKFDTFTVKP